jgi:hypothetical protein
MVFKYLLKYKLELLAISCFCVPTFVFSQEYESDSHEHSFAIGIGSSYMFSNNAATSSGAFFKDFSLADVGIALSGEYRKYWHTGFNCSFDLLYNNVTGTKDNNRHPRDYQYRSQIGEVSGLINFEPFSYFSGERKDFDVYAIAGAGLIGYNVPYHSFSAASDRPLVTDKLKFRGMTYSLIPGIGARLPLTPFIDLRVEGLYHICGSDLLSGFQPITAKHNDWILTGIIKISFRFGGVESMNSAFKD